MPADLETLIAECVERWESDGEAAVAELVSTHPDLADQLRAGLEELPAVGLLGQPREVERVFEEDALPEQLGDFVRRERIGGGGMGVVFRAEQVSLGRDVALKLIRPDQVPLAAARLRFQREAEAIARLQHPGIVPIYAVGEHEGVPWFAMELVRGRTLASLLGELGSSSERLDGASLHDALCAAVGEESTGELPALFAGSWSQTCIRISADIAAALAHCHSRGVIHRDVKPSNILISLDGRALLFDFGLTWIVDDARLTKSGTVGSPAYMAPEQIRQQEVDERTDVYALGATFYEMLTLRLPFVGRDVTKLQEAILRGQARPPSRVSRRVPKDVETACLVAMDRDAARRYQTVEAFERDLRRLLRHEPILAQRPGLVLRARRFCERHPTATVAMVLGALLVVGTPTAIWLQERKANAALAEKARVARENLKVAVDALSRIADAAELDVPGSDPFTHKKLEEVRDLSKRLMHETRDVPELVKIHASAVANLGHSELCLGNATKALSLFKTSIESLSRPGVVHPHYLVGIAHKGQAFALEELGRYEEALRASVTSRRELERALARTSEGRRDRREWIISALMAVHHLQARDVARGGKFSEAIAAAQAGLSLPSQDMRSEPVRIGRLALGCFLADSLDEIGQREAAAKAYGDAIKEAERLAALPTPGRYARLQLANNLARAAALASKLGERVRLQRRAGEIYAALHKDYPAVVAFAQKGAFARSVLADFLWRSGRREEAASEFVEAERDLEELAKTTDHLDVHHSLACHLRLAAQAPDARNLDRARARLQRAVELLRAFRSLGPTEQRTLARCLTSLGIVERRRRDYRASRRALEEAVRVLDDAVAKVPESVPVRRSLAAALHGFAMCCSAEKKVEEETRLLARSVAEKRRIVAAVPGNFGYRASLASSLHNLAGCQLVSKQTAAASRTLTEALGLARACLAVDPDNARYQRRVVDSAEALCWAKLGLGQPEQVPDLAAEVAKAAPNRASVALRAALLLSRAAKAMTGPAAEALAVDAVAMLRECAKRGYRDPSRVKRHTYLRHLRDRPDFRAALKLFPGK